MPTIDPKYPNVMQYTREELREQRKALLAELPFDETELFERQRKYLLTPDEMSIFEGIETIDFLLENS